MSVYASTQPMALTNVQARSVNTIQWLENRSSAAQDVLFQHSSNTGIAFIPPR